MRSLAFRARARASMARITALSAASFVMFTITSAFRTSSNASFALAKNKKNLRKDVVTLRLKRVHAQQ